MSSDFDPFVPLGDSRGVVEAFDESRGLGIVRSEGGVEYPFHCTAIADGTRSIAVGTPVLWGVSGGRLGRWEATGIRPVVD